MARWKNAGEHLLADPEVRAYYDLLTPVCTCRTGCEPPAGTGHGPTGSSSADEHDLVSGAPH